MHNISEKYSKKTGKKIIKYIYGIVTICVTEYHISIIYRSAK